MIRYWFEFEFKSYRELPPGLTRGCGLTAHNYEDAMALLTKMVFKDTPVAPVKKLIENVDVSTLDAGHVLPNIPAPPNVRGVWYPAGYSNYFSSPPYR